MQLHTCSLALVYVLPLPACPPIHSGVVGVKNTDAPPGATALEEHECVY